MVVILDPQSYTPPSFDLFGYPGFSSMPYMFPHVPWDSLKNRAVLDFEMFHFTNNEVRCDLAIPP